jgi:hypothetical protein
MVAMTDPVGKNAMFVVGTLFIAALLGQSIDGTSPARQQDIAPYDRWRTFTTNDGLPSDKAFAVRVAGQRVWVGTDAGLAYYEGGRWHKLTASPTLRCSRSRSAPIRATSGSEPWAG